MSTKEQKQSRIINENMHIDKDAHLFYYIFTICRNPFIYTRHKVKLNNHKLEHCMALSGKKRVI